MSTSTQSSRVQDGGFSVPFWVHLVMSRGLLGLFMIAMVARLMVLSGAERRYLTDKEIGASGNPAKQYGAAAPKTIVDLQPFRQTSSIPITSEEGETGTATLINLNPTINVWYLLKVSWQDGSESTYHLENPERRSQKLILTPAYPIGVKIAGDGEYACNLFGRRSANALVQARNSQAIYAPLCDNRLYLRNAARGERTTLEAATEFLRNQVWGGEKVIVLFHHLLADSHRETAETRVDDSGTASIENRNSQYALPLAPRIDPKYSRQVITAAGLGLAVKTSAHDGLRPGAWYSASDNPGIYVSLIEPGWIEPTILQSYKATVNPLDAVEASSLCYLVAFDLNRFDLGYALGTNQPAVGWADHILPRVKNPALPGPDGIGSISPLISTGLISPTNARRTVATFTGGFKRYHGAFKFGPFAFENHGSHYGFIENGVVFSQLQPGLATLLVLDDGSIRMKTWDAEDDRDLSKVRYARQNGVSLVEFDERSQSTVPGHLVNNWGAGNWSGSEDRKLRTTRSGAALQSDGRTLFLIYAVFSDATPSAMARVFQAYQCRYGMLLDMNALEHTYLALYRREGTQIFVDHLISGMSQIDKSDSSGPVPRFLGYPDNRDFFFVMLRNQ
jgi:hypothetical protein